MAQVFGIIGFFFSLLAIFFVGEVMRRATDRHVKLEAELFKARMRIQDLENRLHRVDRITTEMQHQKKRQAETMTAMADKGETMAPEESLRKPRRVSGSARFTPSEYSRRNSG